MHVFADSVLDFEHMNNTAMMGAGFVSLAQFVNGAGVCAAVQVWRSTTWMRDFRLSRANPYGPRVHHRTKAGRVVTSKQAQPTTLARAKSKAHNTPGGSAISFLMLSSSQLWLTCKLLNPIMMRTVMNLTRQSMIKNMRL
jgi:hypothetical protein